MTQYFRVVLAAAVVGLHAGAAHGRFLGQEFPDFTAVELTSGREFSLSDLRGKVVLVSFWATWCGPCRRELPHLQKIYAQYRDAGFEIVSISLDRSADRCRTYVADNRMNWMHVMEGSGWSDRLVRRYAVRSIPTMYVIDRDGLCIAERPRGSAVELAVRRGLEMPDEPAAAPRPAINAKLARQLGEAGEELSRTAAPLRELMRRLDVTARAVARIDPASGSFTEGNRRQISQAVAALHAIRHDMFMHGVIGDEHTISLPAPSVSRAADPDEAGRLAAAGKALRQMREACDEADEQVRWLSAEINRLRRALTDHATPDLETRVGRVRDETLDLSGAWCEPWLDQLDETDRIIGHLGRALGPEQAGLDSIIDGLAAESAAIRHELARRLEEGGDLEPIRERFSELTRKALETQDRVRQQS